MSKNKILEDFVNNLNFDEAIQLCKLLPNENLPEKFFIFKNGGPHPLWNNDNLVGYPYNNFMFPFLVTVHDFKKGRKIKIIHPTITEKRGWYPFWALRRMNGSFFKITSHRMCMLLNREEEFRSSEIIHHKNGDIVNYSLENLKGVTGSENQKNTKKPPKDRNKTLSELKQKHWFLG